MYPSIIFHLQISLLYLLSLEGHGPNLSMADKNNPLRSLLQIIELGFVSSPGQNFVICSNLTIQKIPNTHLLATGQVVMETEERCLHENHGNQILDKNLNENQPVHFLMVPSRTGKFFEMIHMVTTIFANSMTLNERPKYSPMFYILWPTPIIKEAGNLTHFLVSDENFEKIYPKIKKMPLSAHLYIIFSISQTHQFSIRILEVYGILEKILIINPLNPTTLLLGELPNIAGRRSNLHFQKLVVVAQKDDDFTADIDIQILENGTAKFMPGGSSYKILQDLHQSLNFDYTPLAGKSWTDQDAQGKLTGHGQQVMELEADFCLSSSTILDYRARYLSFLQPIFTESICIFFQSPSIKLARNIFTMPFSTLLWLSLFLTWLLLIGATFSIFRFHGRQKMKLNWCENSQSDHHLDVFTWAVAVLCQKGWSTKKFLDCGALRILILTGTLTSSIFYMIYAAALVSAITSPNIAVKGYEDLLKFNFETVINPRTEAYLDVIILDPLERDRIMRRSTRGQFKKFDDGAIAHQIVTDRWSKLALVVSESTFFGSLIPEGDSQSRDLCQVGRIMGPMTASIVKYAMFMRKGAEYEELFRVKTILLLERGLNRRYWGEYKKKMEPQCLSQPPSYSQVDFWDTYVATSIPIVGHFVCLLILLLERLRWRYLDNHVFA